METLVGRLMVLDAHTPNPQIFWGGRRIEHIDRFHIVWDSEESPHVRLRVSNMTDDLYNELTQNGIVVKRR
jgi:hypothetical protein